MVIDPSLIDLRSPLGRSTGLVGGRGRAMSDISWVELAVFLFFFLLVTVMGFMASRWRRASALDNLDEWGLGGRGFGTFITWFLIGGDIYTAYTFVAVPALLYAGNMIGSNVTEAATGCEEKRAITSSAFGST